MIRYIVILDFESSITDIYPIDEDIYDNMGDLDIYIEDELHISTSNCHYIVCDSIHFN